jgi:hypothetical protein
VVIGEKFGKVHLGQMCQVLRCGLSLCWRRAILHCPIPLTQEFVCPVWVRHQVLDRQAQDGSEGHTPQRSHRLHLVRQR